MTTRVRRSNKPKCTVCGNAQVVHEVIINTTIANGLLVRRLYLCTMHGNTLQISRQAIDIAEKVDA